MSAFFLQSSGGKWSFCMPTSDLPAYVGDCVNSLSTAAPNTWTFVTGVWDATNGQMRLYVSDDGSGSTPVIVSHVASWKSLGALRVGRDTVGVGTAQYSQYWNGMIADPMVYPGVPDLTQIKKMGQDHTVPAGL